MFCEVTYPDRLNQASSEEMKPVDPKVRIPLHLETTGRTQHAKVYHLIVNHHSDVRVVAIQNIRILRGAEMWVMLADTDAQKKHLDFRHTDRIRLAVADYTVRAVPVADVELIRMSFQRSPRKSIRRANRELNLPRSTIHDVVYKRLRLRAYKLQIRHQIKTEDKPGRRTFVETILAKIDENEAFLDMNDAQTDQKDEKKLTESLVEKILPSEGCTGRNDEREKSSVSKKSDDRRHMRRQRGRPAQLNDDDDDDDNDDDDDDDGSSDFISTHFLCDNSHSYSAICNPRNALRTQIGYQEHSPQKSTKQCARETGISRTSVRRIIKTAKLKVFIPRLLDSFNEDDPDRRMQYLTGQLYLNVLSTSVLPAIRTLYENEEFYFQQDGAPSHCHRDVRAYDDNLPGRWIGRRGPIEFPTRSPDLIPLDFYLWKTLKNVVYRRKPATYSLRTLSQTSLEQ
ncbi:hypothetical protein ANN_17386 [Periplaneta americana]|uniref:Uncharacterized protein n=1 Tax=Periplaneta americana TaxID=6978 RepID=A0ABQ8SU37_PERAM|nr:hypothetical protein ANN_17386 [Periplaneta americana]